MTHIQQVMTQIQQVMTDIESDDTDIASDDIDIASEVPEMTNFYTVINWIIEFSQILRSSSVTF